MRSFGLTSPPELPNHPRLAFVETEGHVRQVFTHSAKERVHAFVALEPEAAWVLSEAGIPYLKLEDGYAEANLVSLAQSVLDDQLEWSKWVDGFLLEHIREFAEANFQPAELYLYWLKVCLDSLSIRALTLEWAIRAWSPAWILCPGGMQDHRYFGWDLMYSMSLYPEILRRVIERLGIEATLLDEEQPGADSSKGNRKEHVHRIANEVLTHSVLPLARSVRSWAKLLYSRVSSSDHPDVILQTQYDLRSVWKLAKKRRLRQAVWEVIVDRFRRQVKSGRCREAESWMSETWGEIVARPEFHRPTQVAGYDFWPLAEGRLRYWWHTLVPQQWVVYKAVRESYGDRPPRAVLVSGLGDHVDRAVYGALRSCKVPAYVFQHGGFVGWCDCPAWDANDLALADYELTYGHGVTKYFEVRRALRAGRLAHAISVGSSRLDDLRPKMSCWRRKVRSTVLLVPNVIPRNNRYLDCGTLPDVTEAEIQAAMVAVAREFPDYDFVLKLFPGQVETPATRIARRPGSNCRVEVTARLPALMVRADLIVLNFPSTALLEALLTDRPVLVFVDGRSIRMFPEAKAALSKRAMVAATPEQFVSMFRRALSRGEVEVIPHPDQSFLEMYGTHLNDGHSAERALGSILDPGSAR